MKITRQRSLFLRILFCLGILFAAPSCSGPEAQRSKADQDEPEEVSEIKFFDSDIFDKELSSALRKDPQVLVASLLSPVNVNSIPERLDKWLFMIDEHGGMVLPAADREHAVERGLIGEALSLVIGAYGYVREKVIYGPVENYDATVYYEPASGNVTKVVFIRKEPDIDME